MLWMPSPIRLRSPSVSPSSSLARLTAPSLNPRLRPAALTIPSCQPDCSTAKLINPSCSPDHRRPMLQGTTDCDCILEAADLRSVLGQGGTMITESNSLAESESWNVVPRRASQARAPDIVSDLEERARELLTMAAHDLRSPLAVIRLRAHPIMQRWRSGQEPTPAEWALVLDRVCGVAEDALNMIDDVLAIERVDQSGSPALAPRETDVEAIIKKA